MCLSYSPLQTLQPGRLLVVVILLSSRATLSSVLVVQWPRERNKLRRPHRAAMLYFLHALCYQTPKTVKMDNMTPAQK